MYIGRINNITGRYLYNLPVDIPLPLWYNRCRVEEITHKGGSVMAKQSNEYKAEYAKEHYARIEFTIPKAAKASLEAAAAAAGEKTTEYVKKAVLQRMGLEAWPT